MILLLLQVVFDGQGKHLDLSPHDDTRENGFFGVNLRDYNVVSVSLLTEIYVRHSWRCSCRTQRPRLTIGQQLVGLANFLPHIQR